MTKYRLSGRRDLCGALAALLCVGLSSSAMASEWIRQLGTARDDRAYAVATDAERNIYVAGDLSGPTGRDAWLAKLGPGGRVHWKQQLGTPGDDVAFGVATNAGGKVYVAGWTTGSLGGPLSGTADAWLAKYDDAGHMLWIRQFNGLPGWYYAALEVTTDSDGNVYIVGNSSEDTPASTRGWVRKYDPSGNQLGREFATLPSPDVATDADGNVYTAAVDQYNGEWNVAKHSPLGKLVWSQDYLWDVDSPTNTAPSGVVADGAGNAYVTGSTPGPFGGPLRGGYDAWLAKWARNGRELWRQQFGTAGHDFASEIAADRSGNLYITGSTDGSLGGRNRGGRDAWLAKCGPGGKVLWKEQLGTSRSEEGSAVATDIDGNIYVAGSTEGSLCGTNRGGSDAFVAKFAAR